MLVEKSSTKSTARLPKKCTSHSPICGRRWRNRLLCSREYKRLRAMVPAIATKPKVSKVTVIEETIKYIDQLHSALLLRLRTKGVPHALRGLINIHDTQHLNQMQLRQVVQRVMPENRSEPLYLTPPPPPVCQRTRRSASFRIPQLKKRAKTPN